MKLTWERSESDGYARYEYVITSEFRLRVCAASRDEADGFTVGPFGRKALPLDEAKAKAIINGRREALRRSRLYMEIVDVLKSAQRSQETPCS